MPDKDMKLFCMERFHDFLGENLVVSGSRKHRQLCLMANYQIVETNIVIIFKCGNKTTKFYNDREKILKNL